MCANAEVSGGVFSSQLCVCVWGTTNRGWVGFQLPAVVCALPTSVPTLAANDKGFAFFLSPFPRDERIWLTSRWRYRQKESEPADGHAET